MTALIRGLLDYARVDTGKRVFQEVDCNKVLDDALANLRVTLEESRAEIIRGQLPIIRGDAVQLTQVVQNLVGNALKFRRQDVQTRIEIDAQEKDGQWLLSVKDNGIGFDMAHKDRVFTMFKRLHTRSVYPGTGIGLTVCKKIIERHGGKIWAESQLGEGTTFFFSLPAIEDNLALAS